MTDKTTAVDPVCQTTVHSATAEYRSFHNGKEFYFCSAGCKVSFDKDPGKFVGARASGEGGGH